MQPIILMGAHIKVYINNKQYKVTQGISLEVDYGEEGTYGIDSPWPQEISGGKISIKGRISGVRIKYSGGLQASNIRPLFTDMAASPYISIRIQDRSTGEDLYFITNAKCSNESHTAPSKGSYKLNFDFTGQMILFALDRS